LKKPAYNIYAYIYDYIFYGSDSLRKVLWQKFYNFLCWYGQVLILRYHPAENWQTMNYGYALISDDGKFFDFELEERDKAEFFSFQLYYYTALRNQRQLINRFGRI
jgi:hypothetical protein